MVAATGTMDARPRVAVAGGGEGIIAAASQTAGAKPWHERNE